MKLYLDEHIGKAVINGLRSLGHDVLAVIEHPGLIGLATSENAILAERAGRVLITQNRNFYKLRRNSGIPSTGVVWFTRDSVFSETHRVRMYHALLEYASDLEAGAFVLVDLLRTRVMPFEERRLPVNPRLGFHC